MELNKLVRVDCSLVVLGTPELPPCAHRQGVFLLLINQSPRLLTGRSPSSGRGNLRLSSMVVYATTRPRSTEGTAGHCYVAMWQASNQQGLQQCKPTVFSPDQRETGSYLHAHIIQQEQNNTLTFEALNSAEYEEHHRPSAGPRQPLHAQTRQVRRDSRTFRNLSAFAPDSLEAEAAKPPI